MRRVMLVLLAVASVTIIAQAQQITPGLNNNLSACTSDEYVCDPYLRQKNEPEGACSALNSEHCVFAANSYIGISQSTGDGTAEGGPLETLARLLGREAKNLIAAVPDAWIGIYRCYHGAGGPCVNGLWPGFPADTTTVGTSGPEYGFATASDPACAADDKGLIGCVAMFFNRPATTQSPTNGVIVTRFFRDYNDESRHPIRLDSSIPPSVLANGSAVIGKFADLCTFFYDGRRWHVAWTQFSREGSRIWHVVSSNGKDWSIPANISSPNNRVQRVVFAVDKRPLASGGGAVHAVFRAFGPNTYQMATMPAGASKFNPPVNITALTGPASACVYDPESTTQPADITAEVAWKQYARARDFPSVDTGPDGTIYIAHTERINSDGTPLSVTDCALPAARNAPAAIVLAKLSSSGQKLTDRKAIDIRQRCETAPAPGTPPTDVSSPDGACLTGVPRAAGVQIQPVVRVGSGGGSALPIGDPRRANLVVMYREGRGGIGPAEGFFSGRQARMDMRAAQINPDSLSLLSTAQVSLYEYDPATGNYANRVVPDPNTPGGVMPVLPDPDAPGAHQKILLPFLPLNQAGTIAFHGDYDDVVSIEDFVTDQSGVRWATADDVPALRMVALMGADTRDTGFPLKDGKPSIFGPFPAYGAPGTAECSNPTIRYSNVFASVLTNSVEAWAVQTFKPLGVIWRSWPIVVRHFGTGVGTYRLTLVVQDGFRGSFDERESAPDLRVHTVQILPGSSISIAVFGSQGSALDVKVPSPIKVYVDDLATLKNPEAIIRLNPNPIQYDLPPLAGLGIDTIERHGRPTLSALSVRNYSGAATSPSGGNPNSGAPNSGAPNSGAPNSGAPNSGATSITDIQYVATAETADPNAPPVNTTSGYVAIANFAGSYDIDAQTDAKCKGPGNKCHDIQTIFSRTHTAPTVSGCTATVRSYDEIIGYTALATPNSGAPNSGAPNSGAPNSGAPNSGAPNSGAPNAGANSFTLTPASAPSEGTSAAAAYARRAMASAFAGARTAAAANTGPDGTVVGEPPIDAALVTFRIIHYHGNDVAETAPTTQQAVDSTVGVAVIPQAQKNKAGGPKPLASNDSYTATQTMPLPVSAPGVLGNDVGVIDDAAGNTVPLTAQLVSGPANGTLTFRANGSFEYKPKGSFVGVDYFRYVAKEGPLTSAVATVRITVVPKNP
jgi:hypothetical protein